MLFCGKEPVSMATNKYHTLLRTIQRAAALLCAGMLAFSISSFREFSALADSEETERASEDRFTASLMDREHTYASYLSQIGPQPDGTEEISLDVSAFRAEGIEPAEYEGTEALLFPGEGESAEAVVTVKKAGPFMKSLFNIIRFPEAAGKSRSGWNWTTPSPSAKRLPSCWNGSGGTKRKSRPIRRQAISTVPGRSNARCG